MRGGLPPSLAAPIDSEIARQAVAWLVELGSGEADEALKARWRHWRSANVEHERAWQRIEAVDGRMRGLSGAGAVAALSAVSRSRRQVLRTLLCAGATGGLLALGRESQTWQAWRADFRTAVGEQRRVTLADGTRLMLNTDSAVDVDFDATTRRIELLHGEILVETAHDAAGRPLRLHTHAGQIRPIGTRFTARQRSDDVLVAVLDGRVEVLPHQQALPSTIDAGEQIAFSARAAGPVRPVDAGAASWESGVIFATGTLGEFVAELGRYRPGVLRCDPALASLQLSGVFPVHDTEAVLAALARTLPLRVRRRSRYWVSLVPA